MNPVRLKLYVPDLSSYISFTVAAIRAPWQDDEYGEQAAAWARRHFHQRKLEVSITAVDKVLLAVVLLCLLLCMYLSVYVSIVWISA